MNGRCFFQGLIVTLAVAFGAGCALFQDAMPRPLERPPVIHPTERNKARVAEGSLWSGQGGSLFADNRALGVGDLVQVRIIENMSAARGSTTEIDRSSNIDAGIQNFFGAEAYFGNGVEAKDTAKNVDLEHLVRAQSTSAFDAEADLEMSSRVLANVMAEVYERLPNGNLRIWGSQTMTINNEDVIISLKGVIRPTDIEPDNSISSNLVASAEIITSGKGPAAEATRPGLGQRVFNALWPM